MRAGIGAHECAANGLIEKHYMSNKLIYGLLLACASTAPLAQPNDTQAPAPSGGYALDGSGAVMRSGEGLCWRSGSWTPEASVTGCDGALAPPIAKPIAPAIAPVPATATPVPAPAPVPLRCDFTVTLQGKPFFGFNQAALTAAAKNRIETEVLARLGTCAKIDGILVTGHTDRLGSAAYNEKLSAQRALVVASYLKQQGVSAPIETRGLGDREPIESCNGKLGRRALIDCLAPNRRIVIDVRGNAK